jgi:hypothetical protein
MFFKQQPKTKKICALLTLTIFIIFTCAGHSKYNIEDAPKSHCQLEMSNKSSNISLVPSIIPSIDVSANNNQNSNPPKQQQQPAGQQRYTPNDNAGSKLFNTNKIAPSLPINPAYKHGLIPVHPNQQRSYQQPYCSVLVHREGYFAFKQRPGVIPEDAMCIVSTASHYYARHEGTTIKQIEKLSTLNDRVIANHSNQNDFQQTKYQTYCECNICPSATDNILFAYNKFQQSPYQIIHCDNLPADDNVESSENIPIDADQPAAATLNQEPSQHQMLDCADKTPAVISLNDNRRQNDYFSKKSDSNAKIMNQPAEPTKRGLLGVNRKTDKRISNTMQTPVEPMCFIGICMLLVAGLAAHYLEF